MGHARPRGGRPRPPGARTSRCPTARHRGGCPAVAKETFLGDAAFTPRKRGAGRGPGHSVLEPKPRGTHGKRQRTPQPTPDFALEK